MHRTGSRVGRQSGGGQPACPHRPPCPGCPRYGEPDISTAARSTLEALAHRHGLADVPVVSGATSAFRLRARLAIRGRQGAPKIGMFQLGSHRVVPIPNCSVQHPLINRVVAVVRRALVDADVAPYSEAAARRPRPLPASGGGTQLAACTGGTRCQQCDGGAAGLMPGPGTRTARRRTAQPVVQLPLRAIEHHSRARIRELVRTRQRDRAFRRSRHSLPAGRIRPEQPRCRRAHRRARARRGAGGRMRCRVLCGGRCHRPVAAVPRPRNPHERGGPSFAARHGARDRCAGCGRSRQRRSRAGSGGRGHSGRVGCGRRDRRPAAQGARSRSCSSTWASSHRSASSMSAAGSSRSSRTPRV